MIADLINSNVWLLVAHSLKLRERNSLYSDRNDSKRKAI